MVHVAAPHLAWQPEGLPYENVWQLCLQLLAAEKGCATAAPRERWQPLRTA